MSLTPLQRVLVRADGTVTSILEAYAGEPVEASKLLEVFDTSDEGDGDLLAGGQSVLRRQVLLRGRHTGRNLLLAQTVVALGHLDGTIVDELLESDKPLGVLLAEHRVETFREVLRAGRAEAGPWGAHFGIAGTDEVIFRTYRVVIRQQPTILVTETFPATAFREFPA